MKKIPIPPQLLATLIVPFGIFLTLAPYAFFTGHNHILTIVPFWFIIVPIITFYLPKIFAKEENTLQPSLIGLILFYLFMVLMIYKHYQSDVFQVMMVSAVYNVIVITLTGLSRKLIRKKV